VPSEEEIKRIIELHNNNYSQGQIAKELGRSKSTINEWLHKILKGERFANEEERKKQQTKNATAARPAYDRARRLALNDRLFERLEEFLTEKVTPRDYKDLMISYGILEDKRSLLDPPQTANEDDLLTKFTETLEAHALSTKAGGCVPGLPQDKANPDVRVGEERQD